MFVRKSTRHIIYILLTAVLFLASCSGGAAATPTTDINAINTSIVGTTVAQFSLQFTQTALAAPTSTPVPTETQAAQPAIALPTLSESSPTAGALPTLSFNTTPVAGFTPLATSAGPTLVSITITPFGCNEATLKGETLPDGSIVGAGNKFEKAWEIKNTGTCTWNEGYALVFLRDRSSKKLKGYDIVINHTEEYTRPKHSQSFIVVLTAPDDPGEYKGVWRMKSSDGFFFGPLLSLNIVVN